MIKGESGKERPMNQNQMDFDIRGDEVREECGVFGIYDSGMVPTSVLRSTMAFPPCSTEDRSPAELPSLTPAVQRAM